MPNSLTQLSGLKRPKLLLKAARFGLPAYRRTRDLARLLGGVNSARAKVMDALLELESGCESARRAGDVTYSARAHVEVLTAILAEARMDLAGDQAHP